MKKYFLILGFIFLLSVQYVSSTSFSSYLPGGKNYLEPDNFTFDGQYLESIDPIKVIGGQTYTISFPGDGAIEFTTLDISSGGIIYFQGDVEEQPGCISDAYFAKCTFTVDPGDEYLDISITGSGLAQYYDYFEMEDFQLEEGNTRTTYEEYVIPFNDSNSPEFSGSGAFIMSYYDSYLIDDIIEDHILVVDDIDGDLTNSIVIVSDDYTPNMHIVGEYLVVLEASDAAGNTATFNLTIMIKDEIVPTITGPDIIDVNVIDLSNVEDIIAANYTATDGHDGALNVTVSSDDYTLNKSVLGSYSVSLYTEDDSQNSNIKTITINVNDNTAPELNGSNIVNINLSDSKTETEILAELDITDNYDSIENLNFEIVSGDFAGNENTVGSYELEFMVTDLSENNNIIVIYINVIDDVYPIILGPESLSYSYTEEHTLEEIIEMLTVSDNYDAISTDDLQIITNTFSSRVTDIGSFLIEFSVTDSSGNISNHSMDITIIDDQSPVIYIDNYLITLSSSSTFSPRDALQILISNYELPNGEYEIRTLKNDYDGNENIPGTYEYSLQFTDNNGETFQKDFIIKVPEESKIDINESLILRNVLVYSSILGVVGFVTIKNKSK
jgi:hypothetical protein